VTTRSMSPGDYERYLEGRLAASRSSRTRGRTVRGRSRLAGHLGTLLVAGALLLVTAGLAAGTTYIDLQSAGLSGSTTDGVNGAVGYGTFVQGGVGAGTGTFDPFLTISSNADTEQGVNSCTDNPNGTGCKNLTLDTFYGGSRTHAIQLAGIPVTTYLGVKYREFSLDANDQGSDDYMSIDALKIFMDTQSDLHAYSPITASFGNDSAPPPVKIYDMGADTRVLMRSQSLTPGSGVSDITLLVRDTVFPANCYYGSATCNEWLYFYTHMGGVGSYGGHNYNVTAGFEEWRVRLAPVVNVSKTVVTSYTNTYGWTLDKSVTPTSAAIFNGDTQDAQWTVSWTRTGPIQSAINVHGVITVTNPTGGSVISKSVPATVNSISDVLTTGGPVTVTGCTSGGKSITFPYTLAAQASITCNYSKNLSTTDPDTNTASAVIVDANAAGGTTTYDTGPIAIDFGSATVTELNATAHLTDLQGPLDQTVSGSGSTSYTNTYNTCGTKSNTATLTPSDAGLPLTKDASMTITCYGLTVTKTANPSWLRTFNWTIEKTVDPASSEIFENDRQNIAYSITATKHVASDAYGLTGTITIVNNNPSKAAHITDLTDVADSVNGVIDGSCATPFDIPAGGSVDCDYTVTGLPDADGTNTATATNDNRHWDKTGASLGSIGSTDYSGHHDYLLNAPSGTSGDSASVDDVETVAPGLNVTCSGDCTWPQVISSTTTFNYTDTASSDTAGSYNIDNTASVTFTGGSDSDSKTSTVVVRDLTVTKTAVPTWVRTFDWTVDKSVDPTSIEIDPGTSGVLHYTITATRTIVSDVYGVTGAITIQNNNTTKDAIVTALSDVADGVNPTITDCSFPLTVSAGSSEVCHYTVAVPDADGTNTATATNQNRHWETDGSSLGNIGTTDYQGSKTYHLDDPTSLIDESATVSDPGITCPSGFTCTPDYTSSGNPPWTFNDSGNLMFDVTVAAGAGVPCDTYFPVPNVVTLVEVDSSQSHEADATSMVWTGPCPGQGCTPGFWQGGVGITLWNTIPDPQWTAAGGAGDPPFIETTLFNNFFTSYPGLDGKTMLDIVGTGGGSNWYEKAARDVVAGYLNSSFGLAYPYTTTQISTMWTNAVNTGDDSGFMQIHTDLGAANMLGCQIGSPAPVAATADSTPLLLGSAGLLAVIFLTGVFLGVDGTALRRRRSQ
jgi:hypothetical protein